MMAKMVQIPVQLDPDTLTTVELDDQDYVLRLRKNDRAQAWTLDILSGETEAPIVCGVLLRPDAPLGHLSGVPGAPPGVLLLLDRGGPGAPSAGDLGGRLSLIYQGAT